MKRANIKILTLLLSLIVLPPLMWELKSQVGVVPGSGGIPNDAVQGAGNLTITGAIPYVSAAGTLSQDTPALHWDATNNRLGLGTASPAVQEHLVNSNGSGFPQGIRIESSSTGAVGVQMGNSTTGATDLWQFFLSSDAGKFKIGRAYVADFLTMTSAGSLGIGPSNTSPTGTLHVYDATATTGSTTLTVRAGAGQSSTNLANFIASNGTTYAGLANNGTLFSTDYVSSLSSPVFVLAAGTWNTRGFAVTSDFPIRWSNSATNSLATKDLGLARSSANNLGVTNGSSTTYATIGADNNGALITTVTRTLSAGVTDAYTAGISIAPTYSGAFTVTRHNYINALNPVLQSSAVLTDATLVRFDAAAGTHKAVDSGTTKTTPGTVDAWIKVNINGTIYYIPVYTSKTT